jgi:hypothetical protein
MFLIPEVEERGVMLKILIFEPKRLVPEINLKLANLN